MTPVPLMDATRYATGQPFEEFLSNVHKYEDLWHSVTKRVEIPAELVKQIEITGCPWHVVVVTEDWCIDAIATLPPLAKLADLVEGMDLRVFGRDSNPDLMDAHLTNGGRAIPIAILYDGDWIERGWWGPRPAPLQSWVKTTGITLEKSEKYREIRTWYARDHGKTTLREFADLITAAVTSSAFHTAAATSPTRPHQQRASDRAASSTAAQ